MKVPETRPIDFIKLRRRERIAADRYRKAGALVTRPPADEVSVMGIPEPELTPRVHAAIVELMEELESLRRTLGRAQKRINYLERLADQDILVPVANRDGFIRELARIVSFSERYGEPNSLLLLDVFGMRRINNQHGYVAGDEALRHVAGILLDQTRASDLVGRLGGDEFGVILSRTNAAGAAIKAQGLAESIRGEPVSFEPSGFFVEVQVGTASFETGKSANQLLLDAQESLKSRLLPPNSGR